RGVVVARRGLGHFLRGLVVDGFFVGALGQLGRFLRRFVVDGFFVGALGQLGRFLRRFVVDGFFVGALGQLGRFLRRFGGDRILDGLRLWLRRGDRFGLRRRLGFGGLRRGARDRLGRRRAERGEDAIERGMAQAGVAIADQPEDRGEDDGREDDGEDRE